MVPNDKHSGPTRIPDGVKMIVSVGGHPVAFITDYRIEMKRDRQTARQRNHNPPREGPTPSPAIAGELLGVPEFYFGRSMTAEEIEVAGPIMEAWVQAFAAKLIERAGLDKLICEYVIAQNIRRWPRAALLNLAHAIGMRA